ncbi:hypothetical protein BG011_001687 [Mortierella polycephala]|uniref:Uncharacterized protein n=1 Tax=Mortierella polycephala TaxID=41804 RepID=A0A9P6PJV1_9FUNG|nr:hypothetical protein BG011_001687 [Mortierella polycephala]
MPATWQKFKCGSIERELVLVSSRVPHEPQFIYVDDVLDAFKIHDVDRFEVDGRTIAYVRDDNGIIRRDVEGLEGVELRQLESFLKKSSEENLLGNLYRMTTSDGHVKWVCRDHYRVSYQEKHSQKLRDVGKLAQGEFDEQLGRITILLLLEWFLQRRQRSSGAVRGIQDQLDSDHFELVLQLCRSVAQLFSPKTLLLLHGDNGTLALSEAPRTNSTLTTLDFRYNSIGDKGTLVLSEALKTNSTLTTLNLSYNSVGDNGGMALVYCKSITV